MYYSQKPPSETIYTLNQANDKFEKGHDPALSLSGLPSDRRQVFDEKERNLLHYFLSDILPIVFPILETEQHTSAILDYILPALSNNKSFYHCCLSISAQYLKTTISNDTERINNDIIYHRDATISELHKAFYNNTDHQVILQTILGMVIFQSSLGSFDDTIPDIPWHQHFQAVIALVQNHEVDRLANESHDLLSFNMALIAWIDILGSTILGRAPTLAYIYREKYFSSIKSPLRLREIMGCEDRIIYLISEIACLESLKQSGGIDDIQLCQYIQMLGYQIGGIEIGDDKIRMPFDAYGVLNTEQLRDNMSAIFSLATRIFLCRLVPGFSPEQESCVDLVLRLTQALKFIPYGKGGFDRNLVWVYLIGGSVSTLGSSFRAFFEERIILLGDAKTGRFYYLGCILNGIWEYVDTESGLGIPTFISWRKIMQLRGWDFLLI